MPGEPLAAGQPLLPVSAAPLRPIRVRGGGSRRRSLQAPTRPAPAGAPPRGLLLVLVAHGAWQAVFVTTSLRLAAPGLWAKASGDRSGSRRFEEAVASHRRRREDAPCS